MSDISRRSAPTLAQRVTNRVSRFANDHIRAIFLGPTLVTLLLVFLYPVVQLFWTSLHRTRMRSIRNAPMDPTYNYVRMFEDPTFWGAFENTLIYSFGSVIISVLAGLVIALALDRVTRQWLRNSYTTLILISWAVPLSVVGVAWRWMFNGELGVVNRVLLDLGVIQTTYPFLSSSLPAMVIVILADSWSRIPFAAVILLAGLQSIPQEMYDAAKVDGATALQTFRNVTLPYLRPSFFVAGLINWMFAFRAYSIPFTTTGGGPAGATEMLAIYIHRFGVGLFDYGFASAVSVFLVGVTLVIASVYVLYILEQMQEIEV